MEPNNDLFRNITYFGHKLTVKAVLKCSVQDFRESATPRLHGTLLEGFPWPIEGTGLHGTLL